MGNGEGHKPKLMPMRVLRAILSLGLCAAGFVLVFYAVRGHKIAVAQDREVEETITIPQPPTDPWLPPPPPLTQTITKLLRETSMVPEPALVKDVTIGGVVLLASGELKRTYKAGEETPALCPT
jgi:hypothetical protein